MKRRITLYSILGLCLFFLSLSFGETFSDVLQEKLKTYRRERQPGILYTHIDRNNYMPGDTIWFKSYMLSGMKSEVLHVRITDEQKQVVMQQQFPIYDIRAHGHVALSDTLNDGKYFFYAYTDRMMNFDPEEVFVQPITINSNISERVDMELFAVNSDKIVRGSDVKIGIRVKDQNLALKGATGLYTLWVGNERIRSGDLGTNRQGEAYISFTYPKIADSQSVRFQARLDGERQYATLSLNLRHEGSTLKVNTYPEGGQLVEEVPNNVVFEVLDANKNPVLTKLALNEGGKQIGSIETNQQGIGKFLFTPKKNIPYRITFNESGIAKTVPLGNILREGYSLRLEKDKDQYSAIVFNNSKPETPTLVLRAFDKILWTGKVQVKSGDSARITIPAQDFPRDLLSLAIFEPNGNPFAERLFMNRPTEAAEYQVLIDTIRNSIGKRDKIKVRLTITDRKGSLVKTNLSVAVTEKSSLTLPDYRNIVHTFNFHHLPSASTLTNERAGGELDMLMISKNWGWYDWRHIANYQAKNMINILTNSAGVSGMITKKAKKTLQPLNILLWSKSGLEPIDIDENGYFSILPEKLMVNQFEAKYLVLGTEFFDNYQIKFLDHSVEFDKKVKAGTSLYTSQPFNNVAKYMPPPVNIRNRAIQLKEVNISALGSATIHGNKCSNECGDYVCIYKVLNCPIHNCGEKPKIGIVYRFPYAPNVIYNGCNKAPTRAPQGSIPGGLPAPGTSLRLQAISYPKAFFLPDYSDQASIVPDTRPTIYWEPNLYTDANGKTTFEFYTSGIKQEYTIMVQGIEINTLRPIYHTHTLKL